MENNKSILMAIIAAVVIAGGIGVYALSQNDDDTADINTSETVQQTEQETTEEQTANEQPNIVEAAAATESLSTLVTAVTEADLVTTLSGSGPFTVFAPTNDAFDALPEGTLDNLLAEESKEQLSAILTYHVVSREVFSSNLSDGQVVTTVQGNDLTIKIMDDKVMIMDATGAMAEVVTADVDVSNGVVHIIDGVLMPQ